MELWYLQTFNRDTEDLTLFVMVESTARVNKSNLDGVIVRGPMLNEGQFTGNYRVGWVGVNTGSRISRADLADFILKQTTDTAYLWQAPMVSD